MTPALNPDVWNQINEVFRDVLGDESISVGSTTTAKDIPEWDSITHVLLISEIEKKFSVRFTAGEIQALQNVGEMVVLIEQKRS
jgi:acyl carrier protein